VVRQDFGPTLSSLGELAFKGFGDTGVKRAPLLAQQRAIGRILYKSMLEQVARIRRRDLSTESC